MIESATYTAEVERLREALPRLAPDVQWQVSDLIDLPIIDDPEGTDLDSIVFCGQVGRVKYGQAVPVNMLLHAWNYDEFVKRMIDAMMKRIAHYTREQTMLDYDNPFL